MNAWLRAVSPGLLGLCLVACGNDDDGDGSEGSSGSSPSGGTGATGGATSGGGTGGAVSDEPILCAPAVSSTPTECNSYQESVVLDQPVNAGDTAAVSIRVRSGGLGLTVLGENASCGPFAETTELGEQIFQTDGEYCVEFPVDATYSNLRLQYVYRGESPLVRAICTGGCQ